MKSLFGVMKMLSGVMKSLFGVMKTKKTRLRHSPDQQTPDYRPKESNTAGTTPPQRGPLPRLQYGAIPLEPDNASSLNPRTSISRPPFSLRA